MYCEKCQKKLSPGRTKGLRNSKLRFDILAAQGHKCKICKTTKNLTINHKIPVCVGGSDDISNLEVLCMNCNILEYNRIVKEALKEYFDKR